MTRFEHDSVVPLNDSALSKKEQVAEMFDDIAKKYDFLNRFLSAGTDVTWRKKALSHLKEIKPSSLLDVATGTADVAILAHRILSPNKIVGIDISEGMLEIGRKKIKDIGLPFGAVIAVIYRNGEVIIKDDETILKLNDVLTVITKTEVIQDVTSILK